MDSFLAKHDNEEIAQILSDNTDENYEVDIDWSKIPHKETAEVGENTVGYLKKIYPTYDLISISGTHFLILVPRN